MAISLRSTSTGPNPHSTTSTINLPAGTTTGDFTIIVVSYLGATTVTLPSGWTNIINADGQVACFRLWQSGDPSSVTFTGATVNWWASAAATYIGVDASAPVDTSNSCFANTHDWGNSLYKAPSVNPSWVNDLLLAVLWNSPFVGGGTLTPASGFTSRVVSNPGPCVAITDKQLSSAAATGDASSSWLNTSNSLTGAAQIALHASGDTPATPAAPSVTWGSLFATSGLFSSGAGPQIMLAEVNAQQNDLICIFGAFNNFGASYPTTPTGYAQQASGNGSFLWTRVYQSSDADPVIPLPSTNYATVAAIALRTSGNVLLSTLDQVSSAAGSGSPTTAVLPSLTPGNAHEYLLTWFGQNDPSGGDTWTPPAGLTVQVQSTFGPSAILSDIQPASVPTGTQTAQDTLANQIFGIGLLVSPGPVHTASKSSFFHNGFTALPSPGLAAALIGIGAIRRNKVITRRALLGRG